MHEIGRKGRKKFKFKKKVIESHVINRDFSPHKISTKKLKQDKDTDKNKKSAKLLILDKKN